MRFCLTVVVFIFCICPVSHAEVKYISESGFIIENTLEVTSSSQKAWNALVNDINLWWPKDHTWWGKNTTLSIQPEAGGCFCEKMGENSAEHMRISFVEPYKLLRMTGGLGPLQGMGMYGSLDWRFVESDKSTTVTLSYSVQGINPNGFEQLAPIVDKVQHSQLKRLVDFIKK